MAAVFVIAIAAYEGGPLAVGETRLATLFGADEPNPNPLAVCNGRELEDEACPRNRRGDECGTNYKEIKPVLSGNVMNALFDNDQFVCNPHPSCPSVYSKKFISNNCTQVLVP